MDIRKQFPTRFITSADLDGKSFVLTIKTVTLEEMQSHDQTKVTKPCLWFEGAQRGMVLNKTNSMIIANLYSFETDNWVGKRIEIYGARVKAFGAWHEAIRVREHIPPAPKTPPPAPGGLPVEDGSGLDDEDEVTDHVDVADDLWEPDTGPERATEEQIVKLNELGETYYGTTWPQVKERNVKRVSEGKAQRPGQLTPEQIQKLIDGIVGLIIKHPAHLPAERG